MCIRDRLWIKNPLVDTGIVPTLTGFGISYVLPIVVAGLWASSEPGSLDVYKRQAVELYVQLNPELITDAGVQAIVADIRSDMETNGYQVMEEMGDTMWNAGRMEEAINYYQKSLALHPDNPQILYNLGMIYRSQGNTEPVSYTHLDVYKRQRC